MPYESDNISFNQKQRESLRLAVERDLGVQIRLTADQLKKTDNLVPVLLTKRQVSRLSKARSDNVGLFLKFSHAQLKQMSKSGSGFLIALATAIATGAASAAAGIAVKKIAQKIEDGKEQRIENRAKRQEKREERRNSRQGGSVTFEPIDQVPPLGQDLIVGGCCKYCSQPVKGGEGLYPLGYRGDGLYPLGSGLTPLGSGLYPLGGSGQKKFGASSPFPRGVRPYH